MPRPKNKSELLAEMRKEREALEQFLGALSPEQMTRPRLWCGETQTAQPGAVGAWSVKDVMAHLIEWEQMVLGWYAAGLWGEVPHVPAEGFTWAQLPQLNQRIWEKHRDRALEDIQKEFKRSYGQVLALVEELSEEDLFTPGRFAWARKNTLAAYVVGCGSAHYRWARTEMRKGLKDPHPNPLP